MQIPDRVYRLVSLESHMQLQQSLAILETGNHSSNLRGTLRFDVHASGGGAREYPREPSTDRKSVV